MPAKRYLDLFYEAAATVPAYRAFLKEHNFNSATVESSKSWQLIPQTSKQNYLRAYPLEQLLWRGDIGVPLEYCATSGSTGEPFYFPRTDRLAEQYADLVEYFLQNSSYGQSPTLVIIGFGMGVWIGGTITLRAFQIATNRLNLPVSILPTGYNKVEIFKALKKLSPNYSQTIIVGYPPFVKDLVDEAEGEGVDLSKLNTRFLFAAESFTESFRDYIVLKAGVKDVYRDMLNIYGTADIGAMAYETPLTTLVRRVAIENPGLFNELFGQLAKTPTLAQYDPNHMLFEEVEGEVLITGNSALPLIRYAVGDHGGVFDFTSLEQAFAKHGLSLNEMAEKAGIAKVIKKWPFVYVYERTDFSVTVVGINIYPEFIKEALLQPSLTNSLTQKFTMQTHVDRLHRQSLAINVELKPGIAVNGDLKRTAMKYIVDSLKSKSSEFSEVTKTQPPARLVKVKFCPYGDPKYFGPGTKQRWTQK